MKLKILPLFALLFSVQPALAQRTITGTVTDANTNEALIGANIVIPGTSTGTITDIDGTYSLEVPEDAASLIFSYTGYAAKEVSIVGLARADVALSAGSVLEEVVVVGYTSQQKKDITGAVSIVKAEELSDIATPNVITKLQSKVPGLTFTSSGVPGGNDTQISIRGLTSVFGGTGPLWVIDGVQTTNPAGLNPNDIESIQVLKDAASAGIYGTEAARGVIIVTTKQARGKTSRFSLNSLVTYNTIREDFNVLGGQEWLDVRYVAQGNTPVTAGNFVYEPGTELPAFLDDKNNLRLSNTDWVDVIMNNSISATTDLGYSFANDTWKVYVGAGYASDNGIMEYTNYERGNLRLNASVKLFNDRLTIGENLTVSKFSEVKANATEDALLQNPLIPVYGEDGTWGGPVGAGLQDKWNPLAILYINRNNVEKSLRSFGNVYADVNIVKGLAFSSKLNFDINQFKFDEQTESFNQNGSILGNRIILDNQEFSRFARRRNDAQTYIWTNLLTFRRDFGPHTLDAFIGQEIFDKNQENEFHRVQVPIGTAVDFENIENYDVIADNSILDAYGIGADSRRMSQFAKVSYDFADKYYIASSIRRDGSSRFGRNNRYAVFPTVSLGWTLSNENFLDGSRYIDDLKLRFSWGGNGNADILEYAQYSIFNNALENSNYDLDGDGEGPISEGVSANQVGNPDLKWEQSYQTNVGLDLSLLDYRVKFVVDFYEKNTSDLLLQIIQPSVLGEAGKTLFFNAGDMTNRGVDLALGYNSNPVKDFRYGINFTFSAYRNEVTQLNNADNFILEGVSFTGVGHPIGAYYGYIADGIFRTPEEVAVHAEQTGKGLGYIRYRDLNGDGVINQDDRTIIGNPHPDFIYGINLSLGYKRWSFSCFFDGRQGNDMYNAQRELLDFPYFGFNHGRNTLDAWAPDNANSLIPALSTSDVNDQRRPSTYFVEDGSFFRLRTTNLTYSFSPQVLDKIGFESASVFIQAENLINITSFTGFDYEVPGLSRTGIGIAGLATYPHTKSFSVGLNLDF
ncbi:MAG: TonB-dependent receptor [Lewinellaceae bacterium]|nr:TonB-dependent receptor [Lewinellaceae bacterium]